MAALSGLFAAAGVRACVGQQRDLDATCGAAIDEDAYLATVALKVALKSASLVECACRAGALLAGATPDVVDAYAAFGLNLGMVLQLHNDIAGASLEGSDLRAGKLTLPLIFALESGPAPLQAELAALMSPNRREDLRPEEIDRVRQLLVAAGGLHYAAVVADLYGEHALSCLERAGCEPESDLSCLFGRLRTA